MERRCFRAASAVVVVAAAAAAVEVSAEVIGSQHVSCR